ncbi:unnamed protein product [Vicia faba]|uniref:Uncharacterized protein n=1 Tax=Vicia faba TaxID=3906 RepID=A0AAV0YTP4_VICFA|nr:unnamed protein product [Vicia faba]
MRHLFGCALQHQAHHHLLVIEKLIQKQCEPLPRRRSFAKSVSSKVKFLHPFLVSLWKPISNKTVNWNGFNCKSFECLNGRKLNRDCFHCFDLVNGYENQRFVKSKSKNDFLVDDVLQLGNGGIIIGFDIGIGSGSFAAVMSERNVTVITSTLNVNGPFNEFIAARGLFSVYLSLDHRFPFVQSSIPLSNSKK